MVFVGDRKERKMKTIDISDWTQFSQRAYSKSYLDESGTLMLKTVDADNTESVAYLTEEYRISDAANKLGIPTAKVFDFVKTSNNEVGIVYEYIREKVSCSRAISREPERLNEFMQIYSNVVRKFHDIEADPNLIPSFESKVFSGLDATSIFSEKEKELLKERFVKLPQGNKCIHGDLTPSNVIHSPSGDFIIDLGMLSYGNPLFDFANFNHQVEYLPDDVTMMLFHFDKATLKKCWEIYAQDYFGSKDMREIDEYLKPYAKFAPLPLLNVASDLPSIIVAKEFILSE